MKLLVLISFLFSILLFFSCNNEETYKDPTCICTQRGCERDTSHVILRLKVDTGSFDYNDFGARTIIAVGDDNSIIDTFELNYRFVQNKSYRYLFLDNSLISRELDFRELKFYIQNIELGIFDSISDINFTHNPVTVLCNECQPESCPDQYLDTYSRENFSLKINGIVQDSSTIWLDR